MLMPRSMLATVKSRLIISNLRQCFTRATGRAQKAISDTTVKKFMHKNVSTKIEVLKKTQH